MLAVTKMTEKHHGITNYSFVYNLLLLYTCRNDCKWQMLIQYVALLILDHRVYHYFFLQAQLVAICTCPMWRSSRVSLHKMNWLKMVKEAVSLDVVLSSTLLLHACAARVVVCTSPWLTLTTVGLHFTVTVSSDELLVSDLALQWVACIMKHTWNHTS